MRNWKWRSLNINSNCCAMSCLFARVTAILLRSTQSCPFELFHFIGDNSYESVSPFWFWKTLEDVPKLPNIPCEMLDLPHSLSMFHLTLDFNICYVTRANKFCGADLLDDFALMVRVSLESSSSTSAISFKPSGTGTSDPLGCLTSTRSLLCCSLRSALLDMLSVTRCSEKLRSQLQLTNKWLQP